MIFSVYSAVTSQQIVEIKDNKVSFIAPAFAKSLKKISVESCFAFHMVGEQERIFGRAREISQEDRLYPTALKMYCEAQLLTHPESYKRHPSPIA